jgi:hypothetical protein
MASVSSRPERKLDEIVTPRAAMMTARTSSNGNRRDAEASQKLFRFLKN